MTDVNYPKALTGQNRLLGSLLRDADWSAPVPTCPDWTLLQLMRHVGRGDRWAAAIVRGGEDGGPVDPRQVADGRPPDDVSGAVDWLLAGPTTLLDAVSSVGADAAVWTFVGPRPAEWWIRRRLHEATVHRADAALAAARGYDLDPVLAADGISEWLALVRIMAASGGTPPLGERESLTLRATEEDLPVREWQLAGQSAAEDDTQREGGPGSTVVTGRSVDLLLALLRRPPVGPDVAVDGDGGLWERWLSRTPF